MRFLTAKVKIYAMLPPLLLVKSSIILDHIATKWSVYKRFAIIVPTKSLLMQTYRAVRDRNFDAKIIIHDEMYNHEERFIAVLTQERALRLLDKHDIFFDCLYIDEAHRLFERDSRSILLSRLIKLNRKRWPNSEIVYLSPLITNVDNLKMDTSQEIFEQRIAFNIKEPEYFEYCTSGVVQKYNRFIDEFFPVDIYINMFAYITLNATKRHFAICMPPEKSNNSQMNSHK